MSYAVHEQNNIFAFSFRVGISIGLWFAFTERYWKKDEKSKEIINKRGAAQ